MNLEKRKKLQERKRRSNKSRRTNLPLMMTMKKRKKFL